MSGLSVVLAGGGAKTLWGMGVLDSIRDLLPPVDHWAGVSAGAAMALIQVCGRIPESLDYVVARARANPRNFDPAQVLRGGPVFPHERMFRESILHVLGEGGFERMRAGAPIHILLSHVCAGRGGLRASLGAFGAFTRRDRLGRLHGPASPPPGVAMQVLRSIDARDSAQLADWILMSANTPMISSRMRVGGRRYLDGALIDNVPVRALPESARTGLVLVLLSGPKKVARRPLQSPEGGRILYLAPAEETPARTWDYASGDDFQATLDIGRREGTVLRKRVAELLSPQP